MAEEIIKRFPPHVHYVEPFAGGLAVLFAKPAKWIEKHSEVVNDLNGGLMNFWRCLACEDAFELFKRMVEGTPFAEYTFKSAKKESIKNADWYTGENLSVALAHAFFVRYRQSRQGLGKDFATLSKTRTRRGMNEQVSSWLGAIEGLPEAHERLKRVVVLNRDAVEIIKSEDSPDTFFYLDPPYVHDTRSTTGEYQHEMTLEDHRRLLNTLAPLKGKFLLSGYSHDLYHEFAQLCDWSCDEIEIDNKASSAKIKEIKREMLWMNYASPA